jgi:predicted Fe-S protein YdhL (DUF1289 family)
MNASNAVPNSIQIPEGADSPCVAVCSTLFDDICRGCGRTVMEVSNWVFMDEGEKKAVWTRILAEGYPRRP